MTVLGMPLSMFLVFAATVLAGSLGAIHYLIWHIILRKPFADQRHPVETRGQGTPAVRPGSGGREGRHG